MRFFGFQCPSWSVTQNVPSGSTHTPLAARKPLATISVEDPSGATLRSVPWCGTTAGSAWRALLA
jgi:hypothetical protein